MKECVSFSINYLCLFCQETYRRKGHAEPVGWASTFYCGIEFLHGLYHDGAGAGPVKFAEVDTLPCAKLEPSVLDENDARTADEGGFYVGGRITLTMRERNFFEPQ